MRSDSDAGVATGELKTRLAAPGFRSEMEHQLLEIQEAFDRCLDDAERARRDAEDRLREVERQKKEMEDRLRAAEDQLRETASRLRKLQKTPVIRMARFLKRLRAARATPDGTTPRGG
jgi:septal ring factor EnvC (AmiA/AmiB activator)